MEMERMIEFPHVYMDRRPRTRLRLGWDVAPQALKVVGIRSNNKKANNLSQIVSVPNLKEKPLKKIPERSSLQQITADQYASRSAMLSSLVVAWSPVMHWMSETGSVSTDYSSDHCSILAVGGKSGKISFWRILEPQCFSIMSNKDSTAAFLVGLIHLGLIHLGLLSVPKWLILFVLMGVFGLVGPVLTLGSLSKRLIVPS